MVFGTFHFFPFFLVGAGAAAGAAAGAGAAFPAAVQKPSELHYRIQKNSSKKF